MNRLEEARKIWKNKSDEWIYERLDNELKDKVAEIHRLLEELKLVKNNVALADVSNNEVMLKAIKELKLGGTQQYALGNDDAIRKVLRLLNDC